MGDDKGKQDGIGFSGISSLLPDDLFDATAQQHAQEARTGGSQLAAAPPTRSTTAPTPSKPPPSASQPSTSQPRQPTPQPRSEGGAVWAWIGGIALVIFLIWAASQSGTQPSGQSAYQPPVAQPDSVRPSTPGDGDQGGNPVATAAQSGEPVLQTPPISSGSVYSVAEIRYCLALKQQVEGAKPVVDTYKHGQVDRFNAMVDDYNSRCHHFLYHTGDLEQAQRDVASYTQQFQAEGRRLVRGGDTHSIPAQQPTEPAGTRTTVGDAQRALNALGYNVGVPDGVMGPKTRAAIVAFQRSAGLAPDGRVSDQLLASLNSANSGGGQSPSKVSSTQSAGTTPTTQISQLTYDEKSAIQSACYMASTRGAASYNRCLGTQLQELAKGPREPSLVGLTYDEKSAIQSACYMASTRGAASYNRCLVKQLQELKR